MSFKLFGTLSKLFGTRNKQFGMLSKLFGNRSELFGILSKLFGTHSKQFGTHSELSGEYCEKLFTSCRIISNYCLDDGNLGVVLITTGFLCLRVQTAPQTRGFLARRSALAQSADNHIESRRSLFISGFRSNIGFLCFRF